MLPEWMVEKQGSSVTRQTKTIRRPYHYLTKSIGQMNKAIFDDLSTERYASLKGLWQQLDPRIKLISTVVLIALAALAKSLWVLLGLLGCSIGLMKASRLPVWTLQKRIWGFVPLLTLLAALPGTLNIFVDGDPLLYLYQSPYPDKIFGLIDLPTSIYITRQGSRAALFLVMRVGISVSMGTLLTLTTPIAKLLKSLRVLRIPPLFVMMIEMSYRYLILLLHTSIEMFEARSLRTVGELSLRQKRALVGSSIGALFAKSMVLSDEVYMAMSARGYTGEAVSIGQVQLKRLDLNWIGFLLIIVLITIMGELKLV
ncbi:MAG: cobalt ECF transporter T component CbiQ [Firmicutes bacterium]|nr:cobalt ECF transporter T component CbiQ [Bacillota bacterium]